MSKSAHQMAVTGVDLTAKTFQSIQARAIATGRRISSIMGGAIAAAGAYLSFRSIKGGIDELGNLSDMAMKAGTSVDTLTKSALAFQVAGLNLPVESLAKSFQYLKKQTGEGGMDNFFKVAGEIAKIEDPAKRGAELVKNFGRSGLELQPLIDGGEGAIEKMRILTDIMPGVSQAAANAGDAAADSIKIFGTGAQNLMLRAVGKIISLWADDFPGGIRAGALSAYNYLETFLKKAYASISKWGTNIMASFAWWKDLFSNGYDSANQIFAATTNMSEAEYNARMAAADKARADYLEKLKTLNVDDLAGALGGGGKSAAPIAEEIGTTAAKAAHRVTNQLMMGGSSAANRLALLGPEYQNETKKQTSLLKEIAANTKKAADSEGDTLTVTDLGT